MLVDQLKTMSIDKIGYYPISMGKIKEDKKMNNDGMNLDMNKHGLVIC